MQMRRKVDELGKRREEKVGRGTGVDVQSHKGRANRKNRMKRGRVMLEEEGEVR